MAACHIGELKLIWFVMVTQGLPQNTLYVSAENDAAASVRLRARMSSQQLCGPSLRAREPLLQKNQSRRGRGSGAQK